MTVGKLGKRNVVTARTDTSILDIAKLIKKHNIGDIVIIGSKNEPLGIITDRDIVIKLLADEINPQQMIASDMMSYDLLILNEHQPIQEALEMMAIKGVRRAPIVNHENSLAGLISIDDFALLLSDVMENYGKIIRKQLCHAQKY